MGPGNFGLLRAPLSSMCLTCCAVCCQEFGKHGDEWHRLYAGYPSGVYKVNAVEMTEPLAPYEMLCGLLVPLYVPRVTEEVLYGRRGVTLQTSREVRRPFFDALQSISGHFVMASKA